jgi:hypothetical protein
MIGPLSYLDAALLALGLISALLAMYRGLMRELLSIVSWAVAAAAGYLAFKKAQESVSRRGHRRGYHIPHRAHCCSSYYDADLGRDS